MKKAEQVHPKNPNFLSREVSYKTNIILDWQINNRKIVDIEIKLNDKEYKNYLKRQADAEMDLSNQEYFMKKERQSKYLNELKIQEKHQRRIKRDLKIKISGGEKMINMSPQKYGTSSPESHTRSLARSSDNHKSHDFINNTIDISSLNRQTRPHKFSQYTSQNSLGTPFIR